MAKKGVYISGPTIKMMKKQKFIPGMGLRKRSQGVPNKVDFPHNQDAFGLGYKPTPTDYKTKKKEAMEQAKAKREGKPYLGKKLVIPRTMNGIFVREWEDFPFCGFIKTWVEEGTKKKRHQGLQTFFDKEWSENEDEGMTRKASPTEED